MSTFARDSPDSYWEGLRWMRKMTNSKWQMTDLTDVRKISNSKWQIPSCLLRKIQNNFVIWDLKFITLAKELFLIKLQIPNPACRNLKSCDISAGIADDTSQAPGGFEKVHLYQFDRKFTQPEMTAH